MLKYRRIIQDSARRIAAAANRAAADSISDNAGRPANLTGSMLGRMKQAMDGYKTRGVRWTAKMLTNKSQASQEDVPGAEFLGVVEFDLAECSLKQGFLAQARQIERGQNIAPAEWNQLAGQCRQMLAITPESFVFVHDRSGIIVVPALAIVSASAPVNPHNTYSRAALRFYLDHFESFVGDASLASADPAELARLKVPLALCLTASQIRPVDLQLKLQSIS